MNDGPLIVQSDKTLLLEIDHPQASDARKAIAPFAELERSPEHVHTYRLTPLGLWNARAAGHDAEQVVDTLLTYSRYAVPHALLVDVAETMARYGRLRLEKHPVHGLVLASTDRPVLEEVRSGLALSGPEAGLLTSLPVLAFAVFGLIWQARRRPRSALLTGCVLITPTAFFLLGRFGGNSAPESRHLIFVLPFFTLAVASGIVAASRSAGRLTSPL